MKLSRFKIWFVLTLMASGMAVLSPVRHSHSRSWVRPGKRFLHPELRSLSRRRRQGQRTVCSGAEGAAGRPDPACQEKRRSISLRTGH